MFPADGAAVGAVVGGVARVVAVVARVVGAVAGAVGVEPPRFGGRVVDGVAGGVVGLVAGGPPTVELAAVVGGVEVVGPVVDAGADASWRPDDSPPGGGADDSSPIATALIAPANSRPTTRTRRPCVGRGFTVITASTSPARAFSV